MSILSKLFGTNDKTDWSDPAARWDGTDEHWHYLQAMNKSTRYDHTGDGGNIGEQMNREGHSARGGGNGRTIYSKVTSSTNRQETRHERALGEGAKRLDRMCQTGARVIGGNAFRSKVEYKFNSDHGFGHGRSGKVEVVDNQTVVIHK